MDETTALLGRSSPHKHARARKPQSIVFLLSLVLFFLSCADSLGAVPWTRLLEDAICRRFTIRNAAAPPVDEQSCKTDAVQSELAYLEGLPDTIEAAIGALPLLACRQSATNTRQVCWLPCPTAPFLTGCRHFPNAAGDKAEPRLTGSDENPSCYSSSPATSSSRYGTLWSFTTRTHCHLIPSSFPRPSS